MHFFELLNIEIKNKNMNADNCNYIVIVIAKENRKLIREAHNFGYQAHLGKNLYFFEKKNAKKCATSLNIAPSQDFSC